MNDDTQAVVKDDVTPAPQGEQSQIARKDDADLESLLSQFEQTAAPKPEPITEQKPAGTPAVDDELRRRFAEWEFKQEIIPAIRRVRGDIPEDVLSDDEVQDWLDGRAKRDERLQKAWLNRKTNPRAWANLEKALGAELHKKFSKLPDSQATEDVAAITAAVRGSSTKVPEGKPPDYAKLSNAEYRRKVRDEFGFDPGV
jgi:hypothetical protein